MDIRNASKIQRKEWNIYSDVSRKELTKIKGFKDRLGKRY